MNAPGWLDEALLRLSVAGPEFIPDPGNKLSNGSRVLLAHRNGLPWHEAPVPRRWHRCSAQTIGWDNLTKIDRCACGAIRRDNRVWIRRNERKAGR